VTSSFVQTLGPTARDSLPTFGSRLAEATSLDDLCRAALTQLQHVLQVKRVAVVLREVDCPMRFVASTGLSDDYRQGMQGHDPWPPEAPFRPILLSDIRLAPSLATYGLVLQREGVRALAYIPLTSGERLLGEFVLHYAEPHSCSQDEAQIAEGLAIQLALALDHFRLRRELDQRLSSEGELRRQAQKEVALRVAMEDAIGAGLAIIDAQGTQSYSSSGLCRMLGYSEQELVGARAPFVYWPEEERENIQALFAQTRAEQLVGPDQELRFCRKNGERFDVLVRVSPFMIEGASMGWLASVQDITADKRREARLLENESRLQLALAAGRLGAWDWHIPSGRITWSRELEAIHGIAPDSFDGTFEAFQSDMHPEDRARVLETIKGTISSGREQYSVEYRIIRPDGRQHWIAAQGTVQRDVEGTPVRMLGVCGDITDRKRLEQGRELLAEASRALTLELDEAAALASLARLIVPQMADLCTVHVLAQDGKIEAVAVEHNWLSAMPLCPNWVLKRAAQTETPSAVRLAIKTAWPKLSSAKDARSGSSPHPMNDRAREGERAAEDAEALSFMLVPIHAGGRSVGCVSFWSAQAVRHYSSDDLALAEELVRRAGTAIDNARSLQEARAARAATEHVHKQVQLLVEASDLLAASLDPVNTLRQLADFVVPRLADFCTTYLSDGQLVRSVGLSHRRADKLGLLTALLDVSELSLADETGAGAVIRTGEPLLLSELSDELLCRLAHNGPHQAAIRSLAPRSCMIVPLTTRGRSIGAIAFSFTDDSARKYGSDDLRFAIDLANRVALLVDNARLYSEAQQAIRTRDDIMAVVSHDLRNPLSTIAMTCGLLELDPGPEIRDQAQRSIGRATKQMDRLIQDLLDVSRIDAGGLSMQLATVEVAPLIDEAYAMALPLARDRCVQLERRVAEGISCVDADRGRLLQVLGNLIGNALKFVPAGGKICIGAQDAYGQTRIWVSDNGPGISPECLPKVFDRFWQADRQGGHGAGLGLTIAKSIIEAHGGKIGVQSKEGAGCTFFCWLQSRASRSTNPSAPAHALPEARVASPYPAE
jgi:PAS domain S-box-containing protein